MADTNQMKKPSQSYNGPKINPDHGDRKSDGKSTSLRNLDRPYSSSRIGKPLPFPNGIDYVEGENLVIQANPGLYSPRHE